MTANNRYPHGIADETVDCESGNEGPKADDVKRQKFALKTMFERGLIPETTYLDKLKVLSQSETD